MSAARLFKMGLLFTFTLFVSYLLGAFTAASFNITLWPSASRYFTAMFGVCVAAFISYACTQGEE